MNLLHEWRHNVKITSGVIFMQNLGHDHERHIRARESSPTTLA